MITKVNKMKFYFSNHRPGLHTNYFPWESGLKFLDLYALSPMQKCIKEPGFRFWAPMCPGHLLVSSHAQTNNQSYYLLSRQLKNLFIKIHLSKSTMQSLTDCPTTAYKLYTFNLLSLHNNNNIIYSNHQLQLIKSFTK